MLTMRLEEAKKWIAEHPQVQFGVRFVKKDKTVRAMNCATGIKDDDLLVKNPLNPGLNFKKHNLISVYDTDEKNYRCFAPDRLVAIRIDGVWYAIAENQSIEIVG